MLCVPINAGLMFNNSQSGKSLPILMCTGILARGLRPDSDARLPTPEGACVSRAPPATFERTESRGSPWSVFQDGSDGLPQVNGRRLGAGTTLQPPDSDELKDHPHNEIIRIFLIAVDP